MSELQLLGDTASPEPLFVRVSALIEQTRTTVATQANTALTMMYWEIGRLLDTEILQHQRASYAQEIVGTLSPQLTKQFGRGFDRSNLRRMRKRFRIRMGLTVCHKRGEWEQRPATSAPAME